MFFERNRVRSKKRIPDFLIIGAMKAGTTTLHAYLKRHPEINMALLKEPNFFSGPERFKGKWNLGEHWYRTLFGDESGLTGEASTSYTKFPRGKRVPERIRSLNPNAKLIYLVRHPVDRAISHYLHSVLADREMRTIHDSLLKATGSNYVEVSCYYLQLEQYLPFFPRENICALSSESLWQKPREVLPIVAEFLGIDEGAFSFAKARQDNSTGTKLSKFMNQKLVRRDDAGIKLWKACSRQSDPARLNARQLAELLGFAVDDRRRLMMMVDDDASQLAREFGLPDANDWRHLV
jgi:hypothetical protein